MIRLLLLALLFFLAYTAWSVLVRRLPGRNGTRAEKTSRGEDMVQDPHCGVYLPRSSALTGTVKGERRYFCSEACRDAFTLKK